MRYAFVALWIAVPAWASGIVVECGVPSCIVRANRVVFTSVDGVVRVPAVAGDVRLEIIHRGKRVPVTVRVEDEMIHRIAVDFEKAATTVSASKQATPATAQADVPGWIRSAKADGVTIERVARSGANQVQLDVTSPSPNALALQVEQFRNHDKVRDVEVFEVTQYEAKRYRMKLVLHLR